MTHLRVQDLMRPGLGALAALASPLRHLRLACGLVQQLRSSLSEIADRSRAVEIPTLLSHCGVLSQEALYRRFPSFPSPRMIGFSRRLRQGHAGSDVPVGDLP